MPDLVVPQLGESITEAVVARWLKNVGDTVALDEPVVDLETDKITVQLPSPVAGALSEQRAAVGATVKVGEIVGQVTSGAAGAESPAGPAKTGRNGDRPMATTIPSVATSAAGSTADPSKERVVSSTARPSKDHELDREALLKLPPSRRAAAREAGALPHPTPAPRPPLATPAAARLARAGATDETMPPPFAADPRVEVVAMSPLRHRIAERLVQAQHETASLTTFNEVDMSAVMALRSRWKEDFEKEHGAKLGFMSFFVRACVAACKLYPGVNAEVAGSSIIYKKHYDFGVAVSTPKGLVVPVLRDCDARSFAAIEGGIAELAEKARTAKLALDDLVGGTFTISNGGIYGSMMSTPLLNYPQTGILGMHNIVKRAVVVNDQIEVRPMMYIALTYDHRVVDGREAVGFLVAVKERIEAPDRLLLEV